MSVTKSKTNRLSLFAQKSLYARRLLIQNEKAKPRSSIFDLGPKERLKMKQELALMRKKADFGSTRKRKSFL